MLPQLRRCLRELDIRLALERSALARSTRRLHNGLRSFLGDAEAGKRVAQQAERHLSRAHDGKAHALILEIRDLLGSIGPHGRVDARVGLASEFDDAPLLEALRNGDDQQPGIVDAGRFQNANGCGVAVDGR